MDAKFCDADYHGVEAALGLDFLTFNFYFIHPVHLLKLAPTIFPKTLLVVSIVSYMNLGGFENVHVHHNLQLSGTIII